jgi:hypothetical protein
MPNSQESERGTDKDFVFKVILKPKTSWADGVYLGNMLGEILGLMAKNTAAFEFEIQSEKC